MVGRKHGGAPFKNVVVHGGPGAPGSALGIAELLPSALEPFQTAFSVEGQVEELADVVQSEGAPPVTLIGHSWGAMLSLLVAAKYPLLVKNVVLVCSGGFSSEAYKLTRETRMERLSAQDRLRASEIDEARRNSPGDPLAELTREYYGLLSKADLFDPLPGLEHEAEFQNDVNKSVWSEVVSLRDSGELLDRVASTKCPVIAIHGDYDPHPVRCVEEPLSQVLPDFKMTVLQHCGHEPWRERQARTRFAEHLNELIQ